MARWARHLVVLLLIFSMGCATVRSPWEYTRSIMRPVKPVQREAKSEEEEEERPPLIAQNEESPESESDSPQLQHDPATRMLIEEELRDANAAEKAEWIAFLGTVPTAEVAGMLKERRMAIRRDADQIAQNDDAPESGSSAVRPVAHSMIPEKGDLVSEDSAQSSSADAEARGETASANQTTGAPWQKKLRSLTDPSRLKPHPPGTEEPAEEHSQAAGRQERGPFGLPQILGGKSDSAHSSVVHPEVQQASADQLATPIPPQIPPIESRMTPGAALWEDEMSRLISLLEAEVTSTTRGGDPTRREEIRKQVALRMLYLVANDPQRAMQVIPGLPPDEQEFWTTIFLGLADHLDASGTNDPGERATKTIAQLRTAAYHLQQSANLRLRNLAFCQQINGFGNYETFPADQFDAGQAVLLYGEIRNFKSAPTEDGTFVTRIRSTIEIYSVGDGQQLVDRTSFDPTEDRSRTLRTDYYHSYRLDLPLNLARGPHLVKLILQDEISGKQTMESIPFVVK